MGKWDDIKIIAQLQYTGLRDKNEKEIYESDIVSFILKSGSMRGHRINQEVIYDAVNGYQLPEDGKYLDISGDSYYEEIKEVEVIGNIYENPELLNKENK